jgi:hypothetical protein
MSEISKNIPVETQSEVEGAINVTRANQVAQLAFNNLDKHSPEYLAETFTTTGQSEIAAAEAAVAEADAAESLQDPLASIATPSTELMYINERAAREDWSQERLDAARAEITAKAH